MFNSHTKFVFVTDLINEYNRIQLTKSIYSINEKYHFDGYCATDEKARV